MQEKPFAVVFPGQGSQSLGMLADLATEFPIVEATFKEASEAIDVDLWTVSQQGPAEDLNLTENTQPALLAAGMAVWRVWQSLHADKQPQLLAGHSLGEYTALVAANVLSFADAARLVKLRGQLMQEAVPIGEGAMAAIIGMDDQAVRDLCEAQSQGEVLSAANYNAKGQVVIAGATAAVERAVAAAKPAGAKLAKQIPVSVPSHCALMQSAAVKMADALRDVPFNMPSIPVIQNVDAKASDDTDTIKQNLVAQLTGSVQWVATIEAISTAGIETLFEFGPGKVLVGLNKRIVKTMQALPVFLPEHVALSSSA
ncbi:MAG: malonyl CoA-acyl carrier protein transacylase [marine bacterium B5-7]|nr:MAG: malonyl CoA-acyl carrier protein transacylase [marine bacterium B5-7]